MIPAEFEAIEQGRRRVLRRPVALDVSVEEDRSGRTLCRIVDLSIHGARLQCYSPPRRGSMIRLSLPSGPPIAAEVMWANDFAAGCAFHRPLTVAEYEAAIARDV